MSPDTCVETNTGPKCGSAMTQVCGVKNLYVPGSFGSVDYTLAPSVRARGLKVLGLTEKDLLVDLFADAENAQRSLFCSKGNSAFNYSWRKLNDESGGWLWANPPFDQMDALLEKVKTEPVRMVLLSPYWPKQPWFDDLRHFSETSHVLRREETRYLSKKGLPALQPLIGKQSCSELTPSQKAPPLPTTTLQKRKIRAKVGV